MVRFDTTAWKSVEPVTCLVCGVLVLNKTLHIQWHQQAHMAGKLAEALRFLLEPEFDYPVARRQALEVLRQYDGDQRREGLREIVARSDYSKVGACPSCLLICCAEGTCCYGEGCSR